MKLFRWTLLLGIAGFLSACGGNDDTLTMTLTPTPAQVASGGTTSLEATFAGDASAVTSVEFTQGTTALPTDSTPADGFKVTSLALTAATTFVATAKDESGATLATDDVVVTLSATNPAQPNAEDKTVTTLADVTVVGGATPTGLAVATEKLVALNGEARLKGTATGGEAVVNADGTFTFTPDAGATAGSFDYEVVNGALLDTGKVTVTVNLLPTNTVVVSGANALTAINGAAEGATLIVGSSITCDADPCIQLKTGQTLQGSGTVADVAFSNPNAKLEGNRSTEGDLTTVIELAPNTTVEGLEIFGEDVYSAIRGRDVDLSGTINIKNVKIAGATANAPFSIRHEDGTDFGSFYILNVEGLTVTGATKPMGISGFSSLTFKDSAIDMNITYAPSSAEFGLSFHAYGDATATVDNVDVTSAQAAPEFAPMKFAQSSGGGVYNVTISNNDVSFGDAVDLTTAGAYFVNYGNTSPTTGKIVINTAASTGNTTESTSSEKARFIATGSASIAGRIEGQLQLNGQLVP